MKYINSLKLYAITDSSLCRGRSLENMVESAILGGATMIQLREKNLNYNEFLTRAKAINSICKKYSVPLIINDNIKVAKESMADGVHIGQDDTSCVAAREILGDNAIIGVSAHNIEEARNAMTSGADYIGVGAVFTTSTKLDAKSVSLNELQDIVENVNIPVVAIGGITSNNIEKLSKTGISGAAIISDIFSRDNITEHCIYLSSLLTNIIKNKIQ